MVGDEDVALLDAIVLRVNLDDAAYEMAIDRRMEEHRRRDDEAPGPIENDAAEIPRFADDGGVARTVEMIMHLLDKACDLVADDPDGDRVHAQVAVRMRLR